MIYLFFGNDRDTTRKRCDIFLEKLFQKKPHASFFEFDPENFNEKSFEELLHGRGLFEEEHVVVLKGVLQESDVENIVLKNIKTLADSPHVFVFLEEKLKKKIATALMAHASRVWEADGKKRKTLRDFNVFLLADAFGQRNKKQTWKTFYLARKEGITPENIHGILFWQVKNMLLVYSSNGKNPGLAPFVFHKTKRALQYYSEDELRDFSSDLVSLYHDSRRGLHDMSIALESFILKI